MIQMRGHPQISVTPSILDALRDFRYAYLRYIPNYPIAAYRIEDEKAKNVLFKEFHDVGTFRMDPLLMCELIKQHW
jgi:hypothetical protein